MAATTYNTFQQVFGLSLISNISGRLFGPQPAFQAALQTWIPDAVASVLNSWSVVYGPVVWKKEPNDKSTGPDNVWFVARNSNFLFSDGNFYDTCVIAIAGTAEYSYYGWIVEDTDVYQTVDFNAWVKNSSGLAPPVIDQNVNPGTPHIAYGSAIGSYVVLTTKAPNDPNLPGAGQSLLDFLKSLGTTSNRPQKFIFTGHSLGGALAPVTATISSALGVFKAWAAPDVQVYPSAGPSPGNQAFASIYSQIFQPIVTDSSVPYKAWNCNIVNDKDIVPQAWATNAVLCPKQNLLNIPTIYGTPAIQGISNAIDIMKGLAEHSGLSTYFPLQSSIFTMKAVTPVPADGKAFLDTAGNEHVYQYGQEILGADPFSLYPVPKVLPPAPASLELEPADHDEGGRYSQYPVIGHIDSKLAQLDQQNKAGLEQARSLARTLQGSQGNKVEPVQVHHDEIIGH